jgi:16S rRNA C967 or C1407 C5-methylase (RsmB/RsmF family)/NOL1/NOP2/fmu family ribosome biogenesis protein
MAQLPPEFASRMQAQLQDAYPAFLEALNTPPPVSIRLNPAKPCTLPYPESDPVPWHPQGRYLPERPIFTLDPLFHAGAYYVQEASSMVIAEAVRQTVDLSAPLRVLDLCGAPGGKSTLLAALLSPQSLLIANEVIQTRAAILRENLQRWGNANTWLANHDTQDFLPLGASFDLILVDAPCSGEGLFRKDPGAIQEWSPDNVQLCAGRQRRILANAVQLLQPGGVLLYSTCTYNAMENDQNASWLEQDQQLSPIPLTLAVEWGMEQRGSGVQCYPHQVRGEGFYLAAFRKPGVPAKQVSRKKKKKGGLADWVPIEKSWVPTIEKWWSKREEETLWFREGKGITPIPTTQQTFLLEAVTTLKRLQPSLWIGEMLGPKKFIPHHSLALTTRASRKLTRWEVDKQDALQFLRKDPIAAQPPQQGWLLVTYQGLGLGWVKALPNRVNNKLPKTWRIRMRVES